MCFLLLEPVGAHLVPLLGRHSFWIFFSYSYVVEMKTVDMSDARYSLQTHLPPVCTATLCLVPLLETTLHCCCCQPPLKKAFLLCNCALAVANL